MWSATEVNWRLTVRELENNFYDSVRCPESIQTFRISQLFIIRTGTFWQNVTPFRNVSPLLRRRCEYLKFLTFRKGKIVMEIVDEIREKSTILLIAIFNWTLAPLKREMNANINVQSGELSSANVLTSCNLISLHILHNSMSCNWLSILAFK